MSILPQIGNIYADESYGTEAANLIKHGFVDGRGLLGSAQSAAYKMALRQDQSGYFDDLPADTTKRLQQALADSRMEFYYALEAIKLANDGIDQRLIELHELLKLCLPHVQAAAQAEHTLSAYGPRHELPIDALVQKVKTALK